MIYGYSHFLNWFYELIIELKINQNNQNPSNNNIHSLDLSEIWSGHVIFDGCSE